MPGGLWPNVLLRPWWSAFGIVLHHRNFSGTTADIQETTTGGESGSFVAVLSEELVVHVIGFCSWFWSAKPQCEYHPQRWHCHKGNQSSDKPNEHVLVRRDSLDDLHHYSGQAKAAGSAENKGQDVSKCSHEKEALPRFHGRSSLSQLIHLLAHPAYAILSGLGGDGVTRNLDTPKL